MADAPDPNPFEPPQAPSRPLKAGLTIERTAYGCILTVLVGLACTVAFVVTCFPVGVMLVPLHGPGPLGDGHAGMAVACVVGFVAASVTGYGLVRWFRGPSRPAP